MAATEPLAQFRLNHWRCLTMKSAIPRAWFSMSTRLVLVDCLGRETQFAPILLSRKASKENASWRRIYALCRDGYRCRVCGVPGDEITLHVDPINADGVTLDSMVTVCEHCHCLALNAAVQAESIREFIVAVRYRSGGCVRESSDCRCDSYGTTSWNSV